MNDCSTRCAGVPVRLMFVLPVVLLLGRLPALGQSLYEAPLTLRADSQDVRKGAVLATLEGQTLHLMGAFDGLRTPWAQADLYHGDPNNGGTLIENLALVLADPNALGGGFDRTLTLSPAHAEDLRNGLLYIIIHMTSGDRATALTGQVQLSPLVNPGRMQTRLQHFWQGQPVARGMVQALRTDHGLRLVGYFNGLSSSWQQVILYRGAYGAERVQIGSVFSIVGGLYGGFDHTFALETGWEEDLNNGLLSVEVFTARVPDGLHGQILPFGNQAPAAAQVLTPGPGETLLIGGTYGAPPVNPDEPLTTVSFSPALDPDQHTVGYLWQVSLRPNFNQDDRTRIFDRGTDAAAFTLTVGDAATLFDALMGRPAGEILRDEPVTFYHRILTTDGARYTLGEAVEVTFIRGAITANEPETGVPGVFRLHGNYPNPFNPTTTLTFDLPAPAEVTVEVYNSSGQRVLTVPAGRLAAGTQRRVEVDGTALPSGTYLYRVTAQREHLLEQATGKMLLLK